MGEYDGRICPFCKTKIEARDAAKVCPACGIPHHESCWDENNGCATFGCSGQRYEPRGTNPGDACPRCGAPMTADQAFCGDCGARKAAPPQPHACSKCGARLRESQRFCPKCGQKADLIIDSGTAFAINEFNAKVAGRTKKVVRENGFMDHRRRGASDRDTGHRAVFPR